VADPGLAVGGRRRPAAAARVTRWRLEALGVTAGIRLLNALPESASLSAGAFAGEFAAQMWPRRRELALTNLAAAFPEWSAERRESVLRDHLRHLGRCAAEWARLPSLSDDALLARVEFQGVEHLDEALARGRGVMVATAHFGFWELLMPTLRLHMAPHRLTAVGRVQRNPGLQSLIAARRRLGSGDEPLAQSALAVRRALHSGCAVGVLADHYLSPRHGGLLAPFLGRRAWSNPGPATLSIASGSPLLLAHTRPLTDGRHLVAIGPEIEPAASGDRGRDIATMTERLNAAIEEWIRARPELWLWLHARFRGSEGAVDTAEAPRRR